VVHFRVVVVNWVRSIGVWPVLMTGTWMVIVWVPES
jgi:hypothetical protein